MIFRIHKITYVLSIIFLFNSYVNAVATGALQAGSEEDSEFFALKAEQSVQEQGALDSIQVQQKLQEEESTDHRDSFAYKISKIFQGFNLATVITEDDFYAFGDYTIAELLDKLAGIYILDQGGFGQPKKISINGSSTSHVLFLVDGRSFDDPIVGTIDLGLISIDVIDRIEIYRGGGSFVIGGNAIAGIVHIITKTHTAPRPFSILNISNGDFGTSRFEFGFSRLISGKFSVRASTVRAFTDGARAGGDYTSTRINFKLRYNQSANYSYEFNTLFASDELDLLSDFSVGNSQNSLDQTRLDWQFLCESKFFEKMSVTSQLYQTSVNGELSDSTGMRDDASNIGSRLGVRSDLLWEPAVSLLFYSGVLFEKLNDNRKIEDKVDVTRYGLFAGLNWGLISKAKLMAGARINGFTDFDPEVTNSLGIHLQLSNSIFSYLTLHHDLRYPSPYEVSTTEQSSLELQPEIANVLDVGIHLMKNEWFEAEISLYNRNIDNFILVDLADVRLPEDSTEMQSELNSKGIDLDCKFHLNKSLSAGASYSFFNSEVGQNKERIPLFPESKLDWWIQLSHSFFKSKEMEITARLDGSMVGKRTKELEMNSSNLPSYNSIDFAVKARIVDITFFLRAENILNESYQVLPGFPMPANNTRLGFSWRFYD